MNLDMMIASLHDGNAKADDKMEFASKIQTEQEEAGKSADKNDGKQVLADKMVNAQENIVKIAWKSFKETVASMPDDKSEEDVEKAFKKCCDSAIATMLLATVIAI